MNERKNIDKTVMDRVPFHIRVVGDQFIINNYNFQKN